ncbi:sensor histidine kinase [Paenibacillus senegalensis]|uniref:sensor histidine kinase n=1 Tax=Paenibacillus senegalensis TaxID=1465766 RepID=UPI0002896BC8|nr:sensor histidine kinase [Paenibacillus senegalensis]
MKLFLREHAPLIIVQAVTFSLVMLVYWLDGYRNLSTALYSVFIGLLMFSGYLGWRYVSERLLYKRLSAQLDKMDESMQRFGASPLGDAVEGLLRQQYRHFQGQIKGIEKHREEHLTFINQWAHQMKTPLSVIQLLVQDEDDERSASIRDEADRLEKGLQMVLYAARLESFESDFKVEPVLLRKLAEKAVHENKRLFIRHNVYPEVHIDPSLVIESDAKWLLFVLNQLVINAVKYSAGSGQKVTIHAWKEAEEVWLEVRDRGIGIPKHDLKRVFQPFFTGENGRTHRESTGMGLYVAQQFCQRLGHRIAIESMVGAGTTVRIAFNSAVPYNNVR